MDKSGIMSYELSVSEKGRTSFPAALRRAARLDDSEGIIAQVLGEGRVLLETREAIEARVRANASGFSSSLSTEDVRSARSEDVLAQESSWQRKDELAAAAQARSEQDSDAIGAAALQLLGL